MSNYNIKLQNNNVGLQEVLEILQDKAAGGGSGEAAEWSENEDAIIMGNLTQYENSRVTYIASYTFYSRPNLTSVSFPACSLIDSYAFERSPNLTTVSFPNCTSIHNHVFYMCSKLSIVSFPACEYVGRFAFYSCQRLSSISLPSCSYIGNQAFYGCQNLTSFYLAGSSVATLVDVSAFRYTPMSLSSLTGFYGSIFVPASLVDAYRTATNWGTYASRITAITENSGEDNSNPDKVIITFSIDGTQYQAEEGMSWREWVISDYNTYSFELNNALIVDPNWLGENFEQRVIAFSDTQIAYRTDLIVANHNYIFYIDNGID